MALDQNAGKKRAVGIARNLLLNDENPNKTVSEALSPNVPVASSQSQELKPSPLVSESVNRVETGARSAGDAQFVRPKPRRTRKLSFLATPELETRFKKARLKGGFETIEDAYNEAIKRFCDQVERGEINNF